MKKTDFLKSPIHILEENRSSASSPRPKEMGGKNVYIQERVQKDSKFQRTEDIILSITKHKWKMIMSAKLKHFQDDAQ